MVVCSLLWVAMTLYSCCLGSCATSYIFKPISRVREPCDKAVKWTFVTAIVGAFVLSVAVFLFGLGASQANAEKKRLEREAGTRPPSKTHPNAFRAVVSVVLLAYTMQFIGDSFLICG